MHALVTVIPFFLVTVSGIISLSVYDYRIKIIRDFSVLFNLFAIKGHRPLTHHITVYGIQR